jgi:hypothetical protein
MQAIRVRQKLAQYGHHQSKEPPAYAGLLGGRCPVLTQPWPFPGAARGKPLSGLPRASALELRTWLEVMSLDGTALDTPRFPVRRALRLPGGAPPD